ncbi:hypothetical protein UFOVP54_68 [uncultured Caudovirales phage]|uniref:Uncharacterized protein n=1 Tax=uncultured Caudovirales phage TaxID=2100421 RepID=A0A6J5KW82_9CAUD|nr:hypothetical protein UFOVP54_68 [uncultured Caudovirales phage]
MIKLLNLLVETTQGLNYHLKHKLPLSENIYRYSSKGFLQLFTEARTLHRDGFLQLCEADRILLEETNIGEYGLYEGQQVPLDLPMAYEEINTRLPRAGEQGGNIKRNMTVTDRDNNQLRIVDITDNKVVLKPTGFSGQTVVFPDNYDQFARMFEFWDYFNLVKISEAKAKYIFEGIDTKEISEIENSKIQAYNVISETYDISNSYSDIKITSSGNVINFTFEDKHGIQRRLAYVRGGSVVLLWTDPETQQDSLGDPPRKYADEKVINTFGKILTKVILPKYKSFTFIASDEHRYRLFRAIIANNINKDIFTIVVDDSKKEIEVVEKGTIQEAEYQGKDVQLGKPHRGGPKKFYVYVKDPKTKNVKKVNFGDTTGLSVKIDDPKARHAFAARHKCALEKDRLSPNYWGCHIGRYWKSLGGEKNFSGYW